MFEKVSEKSEMSSAIAEASFLVRRIAEPCPAGDSVKAAIARIIVRTGLTFNRAKDFWNADKRARPRSEEMDRLREVAGKREAATAIQNLLALRQSASTTDPHFNRPFIAALDDALRAMGAEVCPLAVPEDGRFRSDC